MLDWKPYLESICEKYAQWWDTYTLTNVVGNKYDQKVRKSLLLDLQAIAILGLISGLREISRWVICLPVVEG